MGSFMTSKTLPKRQAKTTAEMQLVQQHHLTAAAKISADSGVSHSFSQT